MERIGMDELLDLLNKQPELFNAVLFNPDAVAKKLKSREAKALVYGVDPAAFIQMLQSNAVSAACTKMSIPR